jgi:hypothetical protein
MTGTAFGVTVRVRAAWNTGVAEAHTAPRSERRSKQSPPAHAKPDCSSKSLRMEKKPTTHATVSTFGNKKTMHLRYAGVMRQLWHTQTTNFTNKDLSKK